MTPQANYNRPIVRADNELINWMVGKRMKLPVYFWKDVDTQFPKVKCCILITQGEKKSARYYSPMSDWRIVGHILDLTGMAIDRKEPVATTNSPESIVKYKDSKGEEKTETSTWDIKGAICRAFILYIGEEEADKLLTEAETEMEKVKNGK